MTKRNRFINAEFVTSSSIEDKNNPGKPVYVLDEKKMEKLHFRVNKKMIDYINRWGFNPYVNYEKIVKTIEHYWPCHDDNKPLVFAEPQLDYGLLEEQFGPELAQVTRQKLHRISERKRVKRFISHRKHSIKIAKANRDNPEIKGYTFFSVQPEGYQYKGPETNQEFYNRTWNKLVNETKAQKKATSKEVA